MSGYYRLRKEAAELPPRSSGHQQFELLGMLHTELDQHNLTGHTAVTEIGQKERLHAVHCKPG
jgi:hypothetical protein